MLHFIRHAESVANLAAHKYPKGSSERGAQYQREEYFNAGLSEKGEGQAKEMFERLVEARGFLVGGPAGSVDLVIVSTLRRTLETARLGLLKDGTNTRSLGSDATTPSVVSPTCVWVASDSVREWASGGYHPCDYRGPLSAGWFPVGTGTEAEAGAAARVSCADRYPYADFSGCSDTDPIKPNEPLEGVQKRIREFVKLLVGKKGEARHIAVVSHSAFLSCVWEHVLGARAEDKAFVNCEVKSIPVEEFLKQAEKTGYFLGR